MFTKKSNKPADKNTRSQGCKSAAKGGKLQTAKSVAKSKKTQTVKKAVAKNGTSQDKSDEVLAKLMAIEKETRLKQVRDDVDQLDDEKIAEHLELLLKIMRSGE